MSDPVIGQNHVVIPIGLFNQMSACFYGTGPRFANRNDPNLFENPKPPRGRAGTPSPFTAATTIPPGMEADKRFKPGGFLMKMETAKKAEELARDSLTEDERKLPYNQQRVILNDRARDIYQRLMPPEQPPASEDTVPPTAPTTAGA